MRQIFFQPDGAGGYTAEVPSLPGCRAAGKNISEAFSNIRKAIYQHLDALASAGLPIPESTVISAPSGQGIISDKLLLHEDVIQAIKDTFPNENTQTILDIIDEYGKRPFDIDTERVQVAAVHLSEGNIEQLKRFVTDAKRDYRDVIAYYGIKYGRYP